MGIRMVNPPASEPLTLAEVNMHLRIDIADEDDWVTARIKGARARAESYCEAVLMQRDVDQTLDAFPDEDADIRIELPPMWNKACVAAAPISVLSVTYVDPDGATQTLPGSGYTLDDSNWPFWNLRAFDTSWPATRAQANAVTVHLRVGYAQAADIPGQVRDFMLAAIAYAFKNREATELPDYFFGGLEPFVVTVAA